MFSLAIANEVAPKHQHSPGLTMTLRDQSGPTAIGPRPSPLSDAGCRTLHANVGALPLNIAVLIPKTISIFSNQEKKAWLTLNCWSVCYVLKILGSTYIVGTDPRLKQMPPSIFGKRMALLFDSLLVDATVALISLITLLYFYFEHKFTYWKKRGVPFVKPLPFVGNFKDVLLQRRSPSHFFEDIYKKGRGKPLIGFYIFGKPSVVIRDPAIVKNVLVKDFNVFSDRHIECDPKTDPLGHQNLFVIKGQPWKNLRGKITPVFTSGKMRRVFPLISDCAVNLKRYIHDLGDYGKERHVEVKETMAKFTTDVISSCAFGIKANSLKDPNAEFRNFGRLAFVLSFRRAFEFTVLFFLPKLVPLGRFSFFSAATAEYFRKVLWDVIKAREKTPSERNDLIDLLIQLKNKGFIQDDEVVKMNGGLSKDESTEKLVATPWLPKQQCSSRRVLKLTPPPSPSVCTNWPFPLTSRLKTLRKYTPFAFLERVCSKDYLEPVTGTELPFIISLHGLHKDPEYFPEPERFDPERFSEENKRSITPYTYLPFGEGPHNCIGSRFGLLVVKCSLAYILADYEVDKCSDTPVPIQFSDKAIVLTSTTGIPLIFRRVAGASDK
uniref:Cytochrome P450 n=1 Tax=Timema bartmani TaxID=61472 RepID=A0A7R9ESQ1_9NEOP|nr:unnamed protein product [Timema bartmani]